MRTDNVLLAASATILAAALILVIAAFLILELGTFDPASAFAIP
jgi:hypothetical protein